jgi:hypothetical protein
LAAVDLTPGAPFTINGLTFTWPTAPVGTPTTSKQTAARSISAEGARHSASSALPPGARLPAPP